MKQNNQQAEEDQEILNTEVEDAATEQADIASAAEQLAKENAEKDVKIAELINDAQRTRADFENFRRQVELQKEQYGKIVKEGTVAKMLPLLDDIGRAISAQPEQLAPLAKNLEKTLKSLGLSKIDAQAGTAFNPDLHEAVQSEGDGDTEEIAAELRAGYYYESSIIRPAMVKVVKK